MMLVEPRILNTYPPGRWCTAVAFMGRGDRTSWLAFSYSISVTVLGGFAPFVATWLIAVTGDSLSPAFYLMATALLSIIALTW